MADNNSYRWVDLSNQEETLMRKWTEDDKATLETFARAGVPDHIVGKRIGRSTSSVISQRLKQNIRRGSPRFSWTPEATMKLRQLWDKGVSPKDIAETLFCGYKAVQTKARALDLRPRDKPVKGCQALRRFKRKLEPSTSTPASQQEKDVGRAGPQIPTALARFHVVPAAVINCS